MSVERIVIELETPGDSIGAPRRDLNSVPPRVTGGPFGCTSPAAGQAKRAQARRPSGNGLRPGSASAFDQVGDFRVGAHRSPTETSIASASMTGPP